MDRKFFTGKNLLLSTSMILMIGLGYGLAQFTRSTQGLVVTFHNSSAHAIELLQLDFGSADSQSRIQAFRIAPGQARTLVLNHGLGMGFNLRARFANDEVLEYCALKGNERQEVTLYLQP